MVNRVFLIGFLGNDPDVRYTPGGTAVANFNMATSETRSKNGQRETKTEWHKVVAFGKVAEICGEYLAKGRQVYIEGKLQTRSWEDKDGNKRTSTEIVAGSWVKRMTRRRPPRPIRHGKHHHPSPPRQRMVLTGMTPRMTSRFNDVLSILKGIPYGMPFFYAKDKK